MKLTKIILFLITLCWGVAPLSAQKKITVSGKVLKQGSGEPFVHVNIYIIKDEMFAKNAQKQYNDIYKNGGGRDVFFRDFLQMPPYDALKRDGVSAVDGMYTVYDVPETAWLMYIPYTGDAVIQAVDGRLELPDVQIDDAGGLPPVNVFAVGGDVLVPTVCGRNISIKGEIVIKDENLKDYTRLLIFPYYTECSVIKAGKVSSDTVFLRPIVSYGRQFERTQERRMGFDLSRDALFNWHKDVELNDMGRWPINMNIQVPDPDKHYVVKARISYEDFNSEWENREVFLKFCEDDKPMRFLEVGYEGAFLDPKDPAFKVMPEIKAHDADGNANLTFKVGRAELDPQNPNNELEMTRLMDELAAIEAENSGNVLRTLDIVAKSSPEGTYAYNEQLSRRRAAYAVNQLMNGLSIYTRKRVKLNTGSVVAGWDELADSLAADSLMNEAEAVRAVVERHKGQHDRQSVAMKSLPFYGMLDKIYFPKLRAVKYKYTYETQRALTDAEILQKYDYYKTLPPQKAHFSRYEYWRLVNLLTDSTELADAYKRYYDFTRKNKIKDELAACNHAAFCIRNEQCDTTMLKPFLKTGVRKVDHWTKNEAEEDVMVNRNQVVRNQCLMYMLAEDFLHARGLCEMLPPSEEQELLLAFIICLDCGYDDPEAAAKVAKTSVINGIVIALAMGDLAVAAPMAEEELEDSNPLKHYLLAQIEMKKEFGEEEIATKHLVNCFKLDKSYLDIAREDASFLNKLTGEAPCLDKAEELFIEWEDTVGK